MDGQFPPDYNLYPQQEIGAGSNNDKPIRHTEHVQQAPYGTEKARQEQEQELTRLEAEQLLRQEKALLFTDKKIRSAFIRKVYSILTMQMVIVGLIVVLVHTNEYFRKKIQKIEVIIGAMVFECIMLLVLTCCNVVARTTPINYIFLFLFTIANGITISLVTNVYGIDTVLIAVGITALICFCVTIFAFQTSIDFTGAGMCICLVLVVFFVVTVVLSFFSPEKPVRIIVASIGVLIFSFILIYDTQLMLGGNHRYAISPEDYIFASLALYLDIINIFLYVLQILGEAESD